MIFIKYLIMVANLKWLLIITTVNMFMACRIEGSCLTFSRLSCTQGSKRGLTVQNRPETRLIPAMEFNCTGTLVGWTVSGRNGSGTGYPKLQIWRRNSTNRNLYFKNGPEIQIDAQGSACEFITQNENCHQEFYCRLLAANQISVHSGTDIIGVELPLLNDQGFELLFIGPVSAIVANRQYVWTREISTLNINASSREFLVYDHLLISVDVMCATNIDGCLANTDDCDQVCTNTTCSSQCSCIDGYTLSSCERSCQDIDECMAGTHNCQQRCINIPGGFLCDCNLGYQLNSDRRNCGDINECSSNTTNWCDQICTNTAGSFRCSCNAGYTLSSNQRSCRDINECTAGMHNCQQRCINTDGGFSCSCNSGYQLNSDRITCSDINECSSNTTNWCNQICTNTAGSFRCSCNAGYTLSSNQRSCRDINECTAGMHNCQQRCINTNGGFSCSCNSSYQLNSDRITCSEIRVNGSTKEQSCLITGAVVGGTIGTPLLVTIFLLVVALVCTIKKNQRKSNRRDPATTLTQMTDIHVAGISSGIAKGSVEISPFPSIYNSEHIYSIIHDEDKITSANDDEYIEMNPSHI